MLQVVGRTGKEAYNHTLNAELPNEAASQYSEEVGTNSNDEEISEVSAKNACLSCIAP